MGGGGGGFNNMYELLNLGAVSMYQQDSLCAISQVLFEIPHQISMHIDRLVQEH